LKRVDEDDLSGGVPPLVFERTHDNGEGIKLKMIFFSASVIVGWEDDRAELFFY